MAAGDRAGPFIVGVTTISNFEPIVFPTNKNRFSTDKRHKSIHSCVYRTFSFLLSPLTPILGTTGRAAIHPPSTPNPPS